MVFIKIDKFGYEKNIIKEMTLNNIEFALLNFNVIQDELKLLIEDISITDNKISLFRCNCLISSIDVSDVTITRVISTIPLDKEVNGCILNELKYEYIISFKELNKLKNKSRLNHIYIKSRDVLDYIFIKK